MICANKGGELKPLAKIASGGELSRVMLALKTRLSSVNEICTYLFDEIDAGISGKTARVVGEKFEKDEKAEEEIKGEEEKAKSKKTVKTTKYEHVLPLLAGIEESEDVDGLLLLLNTVGGDIEAGLAIAEMIASISKPTVSLVLGGSHSIGVPIAVSTDYSFIVSTAILHASSLG